LAEALYLYALSPIDFWDGWLTLSDLRAHAPGLLEAVAHRVNVSTPFLKELLWEGDGDWLCSMLPNPETCASEFLLTIKQENNGSTFVISPFVLPWLHGHGEHAVIKWDGAAWVRAPAGPRHL
jgi:hypothetical protein